MLSDLLEIAGDYELENFPWGQDLIDFIMVAEPDTRTCALLTVKATGNQLLHAMTTSNKANRQELLKKKIPNDFANTGVSFNFSQIGGFVLLGTIITVVAFQYLRK